MPSYRNHPVVLCDEVEDLDPQVREPDPTEAEGVDMGGPASRDERAVEDEVFGRDLVPDVGPLRGDPFLQVPSNGRAFRLREWIGVSSRAVFG